MKSLYISATEPRSGKSAVALGLMNLLKHRVDRVGFIKPIGYSSGRGVDEDVEMVRRLFKIEDEPENINPLTIDEAREMLSAGNTDGLLTRVLRAYHKISAQYDITVVEGTDYTGALAALELDINADISKTLDAPVIMVASGEGRTGEDIISQIAAAKESLDVKGCDLIGVVVTKIELGLVDRIAPVLEKGLTQHNIELLGVIPYDHILGRPRMGEIARKIGAKVMFGHAYMHNLVSSTRVAAMTVGNALERFKDGMLLITPGDREDLLLAAMVSRVATTYANISGIILTGGLEPADSVKRLIGGLSGFNIPVLQVPYDTFDTAIKINSMPVTLYAGDHEKVEAVYRLIQRWVKREKLWRLLELERTPKTTPIVFLNNIIERASSSRKRIVMPEGDEERTLKAVSRILAENVADIILLGKEQAIVEAANRVDAKIDKAAIIDPAQNSFLDRYSQVYYELRKHKGINPDHARDTMTDPIYFGTMMVHLGDADGLVSGAVHTTRHTITPAFQIIKTRPGISLVSSVFFMCLEDRVLVYGDCAVNPNPTAEELADIAVSSADTARSFGFDPLIAMLSYSTGVSGVGPEVERVKVATDLVRSKRADLQVEGPIQYDAAISPETAKTKLPESHIAGRANIFIFPDLNAGNTAYKAVQRSAHAIAVGPVLQGLNKPVNDLSRGCLVEDIVYTICITAIQAQAS
ncbi:MAG: phosphate acetyltransferase [Calditrichota bacterium]